MAINRVTVFGAGTALGLEIVRLLRERSVDVTATFRTKREGLQEKLQSLGANAVQLELENASAVSNALEGADGVIFTPILTVSKIAAAQLTESQSAVFFSSNNVLIDPHAKVYAALLLAEEEAKSATPGAVILRPTMIYGYPDDGNISQLMRAMRRWPFVPMPGKGTAIQQPIYYKDLAKAAVDALFDPTMRGTTHSVAGPNAVTQRALYALAATAARARIKAVPIPFGPAAGVLAFLEGVGIKLPISAAQMRRAGADKGPRGAAPIITETRLTDGLAALAAALDGKGGGA